MMITSVIVMKIIIIVIVITIKILIIFIITSINILGPSSDGFHCLGEICALCRCHCTRS